ncbi:hypothetical protein OEZ85_011306 [Tetradesmus obliquus]|uniref:TOG domain-containing protein n=1 Tax=Tetradesmus obliquus TaxID=3088 RepID=A0ABY8TQ31_TETOB|nr:hypothetical protein OEZ85_011306 [Tetradesmus obliquus]
MMQALLAGPLLPPLVLLLSDPLERCRLTALQLLLEAAPLLSDPGALLPGLLPQMVVRMGQLPLQEPAEEVRLAGLQLLEALISKAATSALTPAVEELSLLLARGCEDAFPDAKKAAAAALVALAGRLPAGALEGQAERLLQALLPGLAHQHSKVRLAILSGLQALVLSGIPAGILQTQLSPAVKPLTSLHTCLVLAGPAATPHLQQLLAALTAAMTEEEPEIVTTLASCCRAVGAFVPCNAWLPLLVDALSDSKADSWSAGSANLRGFMSLMRTAEGPCLAALLPQIAQVLQPILADADRDASLRLSLLRLLDSLMEQPGTAGAFSGSNAALVLAALLMPPLVWRAGKAAAAVRFSAITALATFLTAQLAPPEVLLAAVQQQGGGLLPLLAQCLDEDWYSDVRHTACYVERLLLQQVGQRLSDEQRRAIYPELLKRLDDSSNKVRIAVCAALVDFVRSAGSSYCETNSGYLAAGVVLHMDDGDQEVAEAACQVLEALAATQPAVAAAEVKRVQGRFRARHYCDRVLAAAQAAP